MVYKHLRNIHNGLKLCIEKCKPVYDVENSKENWQDNNSECLNFLSFGFVLPPYERSYDSKLNQSDEYKKDTCDHPNVKHAHITDL